MKERQKELRRMAYIIHIMDNPDICLDLEDYFPQTVLENENISDLCVEFDSIYPIPSGFTKDRIYCDAPRVLFDSNTCNLINTYFGGLNRIVSMRYRDFLESLYSMKGNLSPEQFEFIFALKYNPEWIIDLYRKRVAGIGNIYNHGIPTVTAIKDHKERIKEIRHRIRLYDPEITDKINRLYTSHIVDTNKFLDQANFLDEYAIVENNHNIFKQAREANLAIELDRKRYRDRKKQEEQQEFDRILKEIEAVNTLIIARSKPDVFKENGCLHAILITTWIYWLSEICGFSYNVISRYTGYSLNTITGCMMLSNTRLSIARSESRKPIILPTSKGGISLEWHTALISDFYLMECLQMYEISIEKFLKIDDYERHTIAIKTGMRLSDVEAAQNCLKEYNDISSAEKICKELLQVVNKPAITIYDTSKKGVKVWKKSKQNTTATQSSI